MIQKINENKSWFFEKINKIDKPLTRPIKEKRERTQVNKIISEKKITNMEEIQWIVRKYYEQLYVNNLDNLNKTDKFHE